MGSQLLRMRLTLSIGILASVITAVARPAFVKNVVGRRSFEVKQVNEERSASNILSRASDDQQKRDLRQGGIFKLPSTATGVRGKVKVVRSDNGKSLGYISRRLNYHYGWFSPTKSPSDYLIVTIPDSYQRGSGDTTLLSLDNMKHANPPCLTCKYLSLTQHNVYGNVGSGRPAYLWMTAGEKTLAAGGPQNVPNSRGGGGTFYSSASNIWTIGIDGTIVPHWLNYEATEPIRITGAFNRALGSELLFTGDYSTYHKYGEQGPTRGGPNTPAVPVKFIFVPTP